MALDACLMDDECDKKTAITMGNEATRLRIHKINYTRDKPAKKGGSMMVVRKKSGDNRLK